MSHSRIMTQNELVQLISDNMKSGQLPSDFDWHNELLKRGFKSEFENIDFATLNKKLRENNIPLGRCLNLWSNKTLSNFRFSNCSKMPFRRNNKLNNCTFEKCSFMAPIVDQEFSNCKFSETEFKNADIQTSCFNNVSMEKCKFIDTIMINVKSTDLHFTQCVMNAFIMENVSGLTEEDLHLNEIDSACSCVNTAWDCLHDDLILKKINQTDKPIIVMLYAPLDGVANANKLIELYRNYDLNVILITPGKGLKHPIFQQNELISGIILPGGPNVPADDTNIRKKFEIELLDLACDKKIPTLGICRGHQFIGSRFGGEIRNAVNHQEHVIHVKPKKNSLVYERLSKKHQKFEAAKIGANVDEETILTKDTKGTLTYHSACAHNQVLFFDKNKNRDKANVIIVAKASDKVPEALQINNHIITYQHHHESYLEGNVEGGKVAKALLKQYVTMVKTYAAQDKTPAQKPNHKS